MPRPAAGSRPQNARTCPAKHTMKSLKLLALAARLCAALLALPPTLAQHAYYPVAEPGWRVLAPTEIVSTTDGPPYPAGTAGDWFVDRTTTLLPLCNYF